ncbi:PREDICTED: immunoglobulin-binding protein 1-like [Branchiostoma belcheri]|uniref:Immunoglobulin-binding protein 1-like n=1 Tax=Branchiostoma belcheri TaxID=7741 RepID=A0A6P4YHH9_BRABE|nr:PREDICTED: immunoglobulin-binding protein 1-like [Branchiostoma belcheri]
MIAMAEEQGSDGPKLSEIFERGWKIQRDVEKSDEPTGSPNLQDQVKAGMGLLEQAAHMVRELQLFSENEELQEVATCNVRYLLLPVLMSDLTMRHMGEDRLALVQKSKDYLTEFLKVCKSYGVTSEEYKSVESSSSKAGPTDMAAMSRQREATIARFRQQKETEQKLEAMRVTMETRGEDDEVQREYYTLQLEKWVHTALRELSSIDQELEILHMMASRKQGKQDSQPQEQKKPEPHRKPLKPFILTRDKLQAQVFGAGYPSIPTMSMDEYLQKEVQEGKIPAEALNRVPEPAEPGSYDVRRVVPDEAAEAERKQEEEEEKEERDDEERLRKQREFDDFKDDHRRGWGNRQNMG